MLVVVQCYCHWYIIVNPRTPPFPRTPLEVGLWGLKCAWAVRCSQRKPKLVTPQAPSLPLVAIRVSFSLLNNTNHNDYWAPWNANLLVLSKGVIVACPCLRDLGARKEAIARDIQQQLGLALLHIPCSQWISCIFWHTLFTLKHLQRYQRWMQTIDDRFLNLYDYNFLLMIHNRLSNSLWSSLHGMLSLL